ncbi:MAG: hypothetical protein AAGB46_00580 [Verrucomicrobiota bacterium]
MNNLLNATQAKGLSRLRNYIAAMLLGAFATALPVAVQGNGEIDFELVAAFRENLDRFDAELVKMGVATDKIVNVYRKGESIEQASKDWIDLWEEIGFHGVVETKAPYLYPPVWVGFYSMKEVADKKGPVQDMRKAAEQTKAALWQGLGGLRVLAQTTKAEDDVIPALGAHDHHHSDIDPNEKPVEAILEALEHAVEEYAEGHADDAGKLVFNAYMDIFEHLEGDLIESDADLVTALELDFNAGLPLIFKKDGAIEEAKAKVQEMTEKLLKAKTLLEEKAASRSSVF